MVGHKKNSKAAAAPTTHKLSEPASVIAQTIAQTLPEGGGISSAAPALRFPPRSLFPGLGSGPRMVKGPRVTAFDPPPAVAEPPPPPSRPFEHEPPTAPDRPVPQPMHDPASRPTTRPPRREPDPPPAALPFPVVSPPAFAAAHANVYSEDFQARERDRWGKSKHVPQPDTKLVHCWTLALAHFPPSALTLWLTRTTPAQNSYEFWVSGEELIDPMFPDRKLYEVVRRKRRQPTVAESFVGRIRGVSENGTQYDCGYGEIHLPPEEAAPAPPAWGSNAASSPWGAAPPWAGQPTPWGTYPGYGYPMGQPPPWGGPPPHWAQAWQGQAPPPPPANVQSDPALLQVWQASAAATAEVQRLAAASAERAADGQQALMHTLLNRLLAPPAAAPAGGLREQIGMLKDVFTLAETMRGPREEGGGGRGITVHNLGNGERIVESKNGEIDVGATIGLGVKSGITEIVSAIGKVRAGGRGPSMAPAAPAPVSAGAALSGARMQKGPPVDGSANGAATP